MAIIHCHELRRSEGTDATVPMVPSGSAGGAAHGTAAPRSWEDAHLMNRIPFADPSPDPDSHSDESKPLERIAIIPKAAFQWPPDCTWPFIDHGRDSDT